MNTPFQRRTAWVDARIKVGSIRWHVQRFETCPSATVKADDRPPDPLQPGPSNRQPGPAHLPVCLLVHGTGSSADTWDAMARVWAGTDLPAMQLLAIDLPGHGRTHCPDSVALSLPGIAQGLHDLLDTLECTPHWVIGHSAGAAIVLQMHLAHGLQPQRLFSLNGAVLPLRGLPGWLFSPLARFSHASRGMSRFFAWRANNPATLMKLLGSTGSRIDEAMLALYGELFRQPEHCAGVLRLMASWRLEQLAAHLTEIDCPLHLLATDGDRTIALADAHRLRALVPGATLDVVSGLGHLMHEEAPTRLARHIAATPLENTHAHHAPVARSA